MYRALWEVVDAVLLWLLALGWGVASGGWAKQTFPIPE